MTVRNYEPVKVVAYYQARCTNCGKVCDDYGDFTAYGDKDMPVECVVDYQDWAKVDETDELLCPACQPEDEDETKEVPHRSSRFPRYYPCHITWGLYSDTTPETPILRESRYPSRDGGPDRKPCEHWSFQ